MERMQPPLHRPHAWKNQLKNQTSTFGWMSGVLWCLICGYLPCYFNMVYVITVKFCSFGWGVLHFGEGAKLAEVPKFGGGTISFGLRSSGVSPTVLPAWRASQCQNPSLTSDWASMAPSPKLHPRSYVPPRPWTRTSSLRGLIFVHQQSVASIIRVPSPEDPMAIRHPDQRSRAVWRLERMGTPKATPISAST